MAAATARTVRADGIAVVPVQPPPQYVLALAWRHDDLTAAGNRCLAYLRRYRDLHSWIAGADAAELTDDHRPKPLAPLLSGPGQ